MFKVSIKADVQRSRYEPDVTWTLATRFTRAKTGQSVEVPLTQVRLPVAGPPQHQGQGQGQDAAGAGCSQGATTTAGAGATGGPAPARQQSYQELVSEAKAANVHALNLVLGLNQLVDVMVCPEFVWRSSAGVGVKLTAMHVLLH